MTTRKVTIGSIAAAIIAASIYFIVGSGSNLIVDGNDKPYKPGDTIKLEGKFKGGYIQNLAGTESQPIYIIANAEFTGTLDINNIQNVVLAGEDKNGLYFHDISYRPLNISGNPSGLTLKNILIKNCGDYAIAFYFADAYPAFASNIKLLNIKLDNAGTINFRSSTNYAIKGLIKGLEIAGCSFTNTSCGSMVWCGAVEDYNVHDNDIDNVNAFNNNHNGLFFLSGNGKFYNNKAINHQGNLIRAWIYSIGKVPKIFECYNNLAYKSRKYSAFEIQTRPELIIKDTTTFCNASVHHNTAGTMNTSHDWDGQLLDLYDLKGGTIEYYNNLGFDLYSTKPITDMINMGGPPFTRKENNIYKNTWQEAVTDLTTFTSKIPGMGATLGTTSIPDPKPIDTIPVTPAKNDTIRIRDTVYLPGRAIGKYLLTVSKDTVTIKKQ